MALEKHLFVDFETMSGLDIKLGAWLYATQATPIMLGYAINDAPVQCVNFYHGDTIPVDIDAILRDDEWTLVAFNCDFERAIFRRCFPEYDIKYERWHDVMFQARAHGLAGRLEDISEVYGDSKDKGGAAELRKLIKLNKEISSLRAKIASAETAEEKAILNDAIENRLAKGMPSIAKIEHYCKIDIEITRKRFYQLPRTNYPDSAREMKLAKITADINDRGLPIDLGFVHRAAKAADAAKLKLNDRLAELTDGAVTSGYQYAAFSNFLTARFGVSAKTSTAATTIEKLKEDANKYKDSKKLIELCDVWISKGSAVSKFDALINCTYRPTKRCYGTISFNAAARTKRWGGRLYQPQNLKRPDLKDDDLADAVFLLKTQPPEVMADIYTVDDLGDLVRPCITAAEGKLLVVADLASIEQRALMWLVNDKDNLKLFDDIDSGESEFDAYQLTYAKAFGVDDPSTVDKDQRMVGKVMSLLLQYMGGVAGLMKGIIQFGADLDLFIKVVLQNAAEIEVKRAEFEYEEFGKKRNKKISKSEYAALAIARTRWRNANPRVVQFGKALERAFVTAMNNPGYLYAAFNMEREKEKVVAFKYDKEYDFMQMKMPIGRLYYPMPRMQMVKYGEEEAAVKSITVRQAQHKAPRTSYYSGKFLENSASGLSREILATGLIRAVDDYTAHPITLVHDEIVCEEDEDVAEESLDNLITAMTTPIKELPDFPLAAKGYIAKQYKKD